MTFLEVASMMVTCWIATFCAVSNLAVRITMIVTKSNFSYMHRSQVHMSFGCLNGMARGSPASKETILWEARYIFLTPFG